MSGRMTGGKTRSNSFFSGRKKVVQPRAGETNASSPLIPKPAPRVPPSSGTAPSRVGTPGTTAVGRNQLRRSATPESVGEQRGTRWWLYVLAVLIFAGATYFVYVEFLESDSTPAPTSTPAKTFSPTHKPTPTPAPTISSYPTISSAPTTATPYPSPEPTILLDQRTSQPTAVIPHTYQPTNPSDDAAASDDDASTSTDTDGTDTDGEGEGEGDGEETNEYDGAAVHNMGKNGNVGGVRRRRMADERPKVPDTVLDRELSRMKRERKHR